MINLHNIDCMEFMRNVPDKYYDLAIVDPPYGLGAPKQAATPHQRKKGMNRLNSGAGKLKGRVLNNSDTEWDNETPSAEYFLELWRVSKERVIWGGNYFDLPPTRGIICWDKCQPWENFSQIEYAWTSFDKPAALYKFDNRTGNKIHPTQKPIQLYKWLLHNYAKQGDKILDTHGGSMSIAIACYDYGFDLDLCELDAEYYAAGVKRYNNHIKQLSLL